MFYRFPKLYDYFTGKSLDSKQMKMAEADQIFLDSLKIEKLPPGAVVLELACGTGIITQWIAEKRPDVRVIGVDISAAMLATARQKVRNKGLKNVQLIHKPALLLKSADLIGAENGEAPTAEESSIVDMVICAYGYTCFDDQETVFVNTLTMLKPHGAYVIIDAFRFKYSMLNRLSSLILGSDLSRLPWDLLKRELKDFSLIEVQDHLATYYIAKGIKP